MYLGQGSQINLFLTKSRQKVKAATLDIEWTGRVHVYQKSY